MLAHETHELVVLDLVPCAAAREYHNHALAKVFSLDEEPAGAINHALGLAGRGRISVAGEVPLGKADATCRGCRRPSPAPADFAAQFPFFDTAREFVADEAPKCRFEGFVGEAFTRR